MDSLAGTSAGKTIPAHREDYLKRFGALSDADKTALEAFVAARAEHMRRSTGSAMLGAFCNAATVAAALEGVRGELSGKSWEGLAGALDHFEPKYRKVWNDGAIPQAFLERARADARLPEIAALLEKIVKFYGVDPLAATPPRLALVPVPAGYGTHAEAIGGVLLLEIRDGEGLAEEASVIVHENAHFLWSLVPPERKTDLADFAAGMNGRAQREFPHLGEAIPTALGQGVADRLFRPSSWSPDDPWYHVPEIDLCAKRIFPIVRYALEAGQQMDRDFLVRTLAAATRSNPAAKQLAISPR
ncbi:MAG TPA: hypothetical protein VFB67_12770 [Candidatus Polarisedimenticolaceae bacterium]|nr:hypothetical protein [Candidatus Polarisedimenticolaceae bacterium]